MRIVAAWLAGLALAWWLPLAAGATAYAAPAPTSPASTSPAQAASARADAAPMQALTGQTMGTTWSVKLEAREADLPALQRGIQARLDTVVAQMSTWEADSDLSRFNRAAAGTRQALPAGFHQVLSAALQLAADTDGAFDPTVGPLVNLWGFGPDGRRGQAPQADELAAARARVGWQRLQIDDHGNAVQPGGAYVDLSGIAKGYGVDEVARFLSEQDVPAFLVEVGGELRSHGHKRDGSPWRIAVESPAPEDMVAAGANGPGGSPANTGDAGAAAQTVVALDGLAMATSGDYRHYFEQDRRRYAHTIDPRTGAPVQHALASVTVLHEQCMQADALATALTVLGPAQGWDYALRHGLAVRLVWHADDGFASRMTPAFAAHVQTP